MKSFLTQEVASKNWISTTLMSMLVFVCGGIALLVWSIHIVRGPQFLQTVLDPFSRTSDYGELLRNADCEIVIYGDSSAKVGFDPAMVQKAIGLKTCNLSQTRPILYRLGTEPLDLYLAHNRKPRILILQLAPETFYRQHSLWTNEYANWVIRHGSAIRVASLLHTEGEETLPYLRKVIYYHLHEPRADLQAFQRRYGATVEGFKTDAITRLPDPPQTHCEMLQPATNTPLDLA